MKNGNITLAQVAADGRAIWAGHPFQSYLHVAAVLSHTVGDVAGAARDIQEGNLQQVLTDPAIWDLKREIGNLIATSIRIVDELGWDPADVLAAAYDCQRKYRGKQEGGEHGEAE